uniref:Uncharacterized protein n=1 Tax=Lepeophtheirus salmonis TaxID=72036 RepID=A0A0K2V843_LEPSM
MMYTKLSSSLISKYSARSTTARHVCFVARKFLQSGILRSTF